MKRIIKAGFFQKIVLPSLLAIVLFVIAAFAFIVPTFENNAILQKKTMLNELTNTVLSILSKYHNDEIKGLISTEEAQSKAKDEIEALRYGVDKKDYFWITDLKPTMIMHPYMHELNNKSLQEFQDPDGKKIFIEAVKIAQTDGEGFISYKWQFKDDTNQVVPKLSFIKKFAPWGWIIGTGIYLNDVQLEISKLTRKLIFILIAIFVIISMIISFITYQSLNIEKKRRKAEKQLSESREKYKSLIESSTEGIILLQNDKISFSNSFIQNWLQYSSSEMLDVNIENIIYSDDKFNINDFDNDSKIEISVVKKDGTKSDAILSILTVKFANKEGVLMTFQDTSEHRTTQYELEETKRCMYNISQVANFGFFKFNMKRNSQLIEFNDIIVSLLGYNNAAELRNISFFNLFSKKSDIKKLLLDLKTKQKVQGRQISLKKKDGTTILVNISLTFNESNVHKYCYGIIQSANNQLSNREFDQFSHDFTSAFARNQQPIKSYSGPVVKCQSNSSIQLAIELMTLNNTTHILVMIDQNYVGIVTYSDIINRMLNLNISLDSLVTDVMTSPIVFVDIDSHMSDVVNNMKKNSISHIVLKNNLGEVIGVVDKTNLFGVYISTNDLINNLLEQKSTTSDLLHIRNELPKLVRPLLNEIGSANTFSKIISKFNDQITNRIIQNAIKEIGAPPVPFAFISIGSAGREELTFNSDQDNAIIFEDSKEHPIEYLQKYFHELSTIICTNLDKTGLVFCKGGYMANNPKWCQPLSKWKNYFNEWIVEADAKNIMNISVFFDLRFIYGEETLFTSIEDYIFEALHGQSTFFYLLAQTTVGFKTPINVFGNISGKKSESIDVKNCLAQIIMFARLYALNNNIRHKGTLDRVEQLNKLEVLSNSTTEEIFFQYHFLMQLRLKQHLTDISENNEITNHIFPKKMSEMEQVILKKVLSQMNGYGEKISANFMSAYKG